MLVTDIHIKAVGGIKDLQLRFNPRLNIICGPNSVGKTTVLECVSHMFTYMGSSLLKRNSASEKGEISLKGEELKVPFSKQTDVENYIPDKNNVLSGMANFSNKIISIKTDRKFSYQNLSAIGKDQLHDSSICQSLIESGIKISEVKNWFINRYLFLDKEKSLSPEQISNFNLACDCFSILHKGYKFSHVLADSYDIILSTPHGDIYYEYLSAGFKSIIYILFGIINEIEHRFKDPKIKAEDFDGIILIDEIDAHLHPSWQPKVVEILLRLFPKVQFFMTTHSPHLIQMAEPENIIVLENIECNIRQRQIPKSGYGFKGWTIEEILSDVMGMEDLRNDLYKSKLKDFEKALDDNDRNQAEMIFAELSEMLHPDNVLRKVLEIQMAGVGSSPN